MYDNIHKNDKKTNQKNSYHNTEFILYLIDNVFTYLPLITATFLSVYDQVPLTERERKVLTNATVESSFKDLKQRQLGKVKNQPTKDVIMPLYLDTLGTATKFMAFEGKTNKGKKRKNLRNRVINTIKDRLDKRKKKNHNDQSLEKRRKVDLSDDYADLTIKDDEEETWHNSLTENSILNMLTNSSGTIAEIDTDGLPKVDEPEEKWKKTEAVSSTTKKLMSFTKVQNKIEREKEEQETIIVLDESIINEESFHKHLGQRNTNEKATTSTPQKKDVTSILKTKNLKPKKSEKKAISINPPKVNCFNPALEKRDMDQLNDR